MDKFYLLLRRYTNATFRLLARENWSLESIRQVTAILTEGMGPISWKEKSVPSSIATHLADVYLDELDNVLSRPEVTAHVSESSRSLSPSLAREDPFSSPICCPESSWNFGGHPLSFQVSGGIATDTEST